MLDETLVVPWVASMAENSVAHSAGYLVASMDVILVVRKAALTVGYSVARSAACSVALTALKLAAYSAAC